MTVTEREEVNCWENMVKLGMYRTLHQPRKRRPANRRELGPYESASVADIESVQTNSGKHLDLGNGIGERDASMI